MEAVIEKKIAEEERHFVTPASPGVVGADKTQWPAMFVDQQGAKHYTATYRGFDENTGLAKIEMGPPGKSVPTTLLDIGAGKLSKDDRAALDSKLRASGARCPLLLREVPGAPHAQRERFVPVEAYGGNARALVVRDVMPEGAKPGADANAVRQAEVDLAARKVNSIWLDKAPPPKEGQPWGEWTNDAVNRSLVQSISQLKKLGMPCETGNASAPGGAEKSAGVVSAMMRRAAANVNDSSGLHQPIMKAPEGDATRAVDAARQTGLPANVRQLLQNPEAGTLVGHSKDQEGVQGVGVVFKDGDGVYKVAESARLGESEVKDNVGLRVTPLESWVNQQARVGADIYAAAPTVLRDKAAPVELSQAQEHTEAAPPQAPEDHAHGATMQ
jgi:hypothetical protein